MFTLPGTVFRVIKTSSEYASSSFQLLDGRICVVFENVSSFSRFNSFFTDHVHLQKDQKGVFQKAQMLQPGIQSKMKYTANARPLTINGITWIYFNAYNGSTGYWGRFVFDETNSSTQIEWLQSQKASKDNTVPGYFRQ